MSVLTIPLSDDAVERLKALAKRRGVSVNRLIEETVTHLLAEFDSEAMFQLRAERGRDKAARGGKLLRQARGVA